MTVLDGRAPRSVVLSYADLARSSRFWTTEKRVVQNRSHSREAPLMTAAFLYDAVRTPFGRFGGALAEIRPTTWPPPWSGPCSNARRTSTRGGSTRSSSATPTAPARTTATSAGWPCCWPGCRSRCPATTVNRLCGSSLDAAMIGLAHDRDRRRRHRARRRRGVDDPGAVGAAQAGPAVPGRRRRPRSRPRWAGGWSTRRCRRSGRSRWARPTSSCAERYGISRERQDAFAARSHQLADAAWDDGLLRRPRRSPVPGAELARDEGDPRRHHRREAGRR